MCESLALGAGVDDPEYDIECTIVHRARKALRLRHVEHAGVLGCGSPTVVGRVNLPSRNLLRCRKTLAW